MISLDDFDEIWLFDFEFKQDDGENPIPHCVVAIEYRTGRVVRQWCERGSPPPYRTDDRVLFVSYQAAAEVSCHLALGWPIPKNILDPYVEFFRLISGKKGEDGGKPARGLLAAASYYGIETISEAEKKEMRDLAIRGSPFTPCERQALIEYCETDVVVLYHLLPKMIKDLNLNHALLSGRYMISVARMERNGIPFDMEGYQRFLSNWEDVREDFILEKNLNYGVYDGTELNMSKFVNYLKHKHILNSWPRTEATGKLSLKTDAFKDMARSHKYLNELYELRSTLAQMKSRGLHIGKDGRNRCSIMPFGTITGRNTPSTTKGIFGPSRWFRSYIKPTEGMAIAYIDWEQQEFGIGAAFSGDDTMMSDYKSGDPYIALAKQAGVVPWDATKLTHPDERDVFKTAALAIQYGQRERSLSRNLDVSMMKARMILDAHERRYAKFWKWSDNILNYAMLSGGLHTVFGWRTYVVVEKRYGEIATSNPRSLMNFPLQGNGAEMLRLACIMITERGIKLCMPVHDAVLVEAPLSEIDEVVKTCKELMRQASMKVCGFPLRTEEVIVRYPDRYYDKRGKATWDLLQRLLREKGL